MQPRIRLLMTALTAALILSAALTTAAAARRLFLSNTGIRAVWRELTFSSERVAGGVEIICPVTIEGTFHSQTLSKVSGQLIGFITRAALGARERCAFANGATDVVILQGSLPWHIRYDSFEGTLPRIRKVRLQLIGVSFLISVGIVTCLYRSTAASPAFGQAVVNEATGTSTSLDAERETAIPLFSGLGCPGQGFFRGSSEPVTLLSAPNVISIRLVQ